MIPATTTSPSSPAVRTAELWQAVESSIREACLLRAEGREPAAIQILQHALPPLVAEWSRGAGKPSAQCQQLLRELIAQVQQQVATAAMCKRLVLRSVAPQAAQPEGRSEAVRLSRRVPLADIPGMLDALEEGERTAAFRRHYFPSNAQRLGAAVAMA
jgi:hypothetical protein